MSLHSVYCIGTNITKEIEMRCKACDKQLSDFEATRKSLESGDFIDLCNNCFSYVSDSMHVSIRMDLMHVNDDLEIEDKLK